MTIQGLPPDKSPNEILKLMAHMSVDDRLTLDGFVFALDASPLLFDNREDYFPIAIIEGDEEATWYPSGEPGDPIDDETTWVRV